MTEYSGAYRIITREEAITLKAQGANVDWMEGAGCVVYDQQALKEFKADCEWIHRWRRA